MNGFDTNGAGLKDLLAQNAIRRLLSLYCDAVSRKDADAVGALFAPDARVAIAGARERVGLDQIVEGFRRATESFTFLYQKCDAGLIDVHEDCARSRIGVLEANRAAGAEALNVIFGTYEDEYCRLSEGWRFQSRKFTLRLQVLLPAAQMREFPELVPIFGFDGR